MKRILIVLAAFACVMAAGVSGGMAGQNAALVGTWSGEFAGEPFQLILNADGTGQMDGPIQWQVQGSKLVIAEDDGSTEYKFVLKGSKLTVSGGDLEAPLTLTRAGGSGKATAPSVQAPAGKPAGRPCNSWPASTRPTAATPPIRGRIPVRNEERCAATACSSSAARLPVLVRRAWPVCRAATMAAGRQKATSFAAR